MNMDINRFWEENHNQNPPLTDKMVTIAETTLNVQLPTLLIDLLKVQNGGYTKGFAFPTKIKTTWSENHVPLNQLFGIITERSFGSEQSILDTDYMIKEWGLPEKQVLLSGDGHWWITLDYRQHKIPTVRWIDTECDEDIHLSNSFEDFINCLVLEDEFSE